MHNYMLPYCRLCGNTYQNMDYPKKKLKENEITTHITVLELQFVVLCPATCRAFSLYDGV